MSGGLLDYLTEAAHISAGLGCTFREASEIVKAAHEYEAKKDQADAWGHVIYVDFAARHRIDHGQLA
jgi:hypothetical protein